MDRDTIAREVAAGAVRFQPEVKRPEVAIVSMNDISSNRSVASLAIRGTIYGEPVEAGCTVEIVWHKEQCNRCSRISGSYYEGVIQVRAQGRQPTGLELQRAVQISCEVENSMQEAGERLSYISDVNETREGLDIVVGSQHIGQQISQTIVQQLGGRFTTHPKLVGEKDGRQIFRITYSVRLPRFQRGDVVLAGRRYGEVVYTGAQQVRIFDLADGSVRSVKEDSVERLIGNVKDAEEAIVAYADGDVLGVLDPGTGITTECVIGPRVRALAGEKIRVLKDRNHLVLIR
jgi:nonsense-mediated mRNA decay protein 3